MKIAGIYKITHIDTNRCYIGQSKDIYKRWRYHKRETSWNNKKDKNKHLYLSFKKYGLERFTFDIIWICPNNVKNIKKTLDIVEIYFIKKYNSFNNGFNETLGGDGVKGYQLTEEQKNKISIRVKLNPPMKGKHHSKETRELISKMGIGRKQSIETKLKRKNSILKLPNAFNKKKVVCYFIDDMSIYKHYNSMEDACNDTHTCKPNICKCCTGERQCAGNINGRKLTWRYSLK